MAGHLSVSVDGTPLSWGPGKGAGAIYFGYGVSDKTRSPCASNPLLAQLLAEWTRGAAAHGALDLRVGDQAHVLEDVADPVAAAQRETVSAAQI